MKDRQVLIVDDEPKMRRVLEIMLHQMGHRTLSAANGREALALFGANTVHLVITDLRMPEMDGLELLASLRAQESDVPVMVITAHGTIETAVAAMKRGAIDYLLRPFDIDALESAVERIFSTASTALENTFLRQEVDRGWGAFVGVSAPMRAVYDLIKQVASSKASVLVTGETGTGKELAARAIHGTSPRRDKLFVPINCAALPADILEAELFGSVRGAFTGSIKDRIGKFEYADGGTIFLDELTEMPMALQAKLLRVLQEGTIERLGGNKTIKLDMRIIAATNVDPLRAIDDGKLREDLYYRVNVVTVELPPLRQRTEDIEHLVKHFLARHGHAGKPAEMTAGVLTRMRAYAWPGNVRELENMIERALIVSDGGPLTEQHFLFVEPRAGRGVAAVPCAVAVSASSASSEALPSLQQAVEALETHLIETALRLSDGNRARAAALLDISERSLWYKLKRRSGDSSRK